MATDPDTFVWQQKIRDGLTRRLGRHNSPSQFINQLQLAQVRCAESTKALRRLMLRAPSLRRWVRAASTQTLALGVPPDIRATTTGYWQGLAPGSALDREARWVELCTEVFAQRALLAHGLCMLSDHGLAMVLELVDAPDVSTRLAAGGAWERLQVSGLLWPRDVAGGVSVAGALHLYRSGDGLNNRQVVYLPASVQPFHEFDSLRQLQHRLPEVINGAQRALLWQCLPLVHRHELALDVNSTVQAFSVRRAPILTADALRQSALAQLHTQRDNEWASIDSRYAPWLTDKVGQGCDMSPAQRLRLIERSRHGAPDMPGLSIAVEQLLGWDGYRRTGHITCAGLGAGMAFRTREALVRRHEQGLLALLDPADWSRDHQPFGAFITLQTQWQQQAETVRLLLEGHTSQLGQKAFWMYVPAGASRHRAAQWLLARSQALLQDAQLQYRLGLISEDNLAALSEALAWRAPAEDSTRSTRVVQLSVGRSGQPLYRLVGVFVVTTVQALVQPQARHPVLLQVPGIDGGLQAFESLDELQVCIDASLKSPDGSMLWRCIGRDERAQAKALVAALGTQAMFVSFQLMGADVLADSFKEQIKCQARVERWVAQGAKPFSEVTDPTLTHTLLARELADNLHLPTSAARAMALANVSLLRLAAARTNAFPAWLTTAPRALRKRYQGHYIHYLTSVQALEEQLLKMLPSLQTFARKNLLAQLSREGLIHLDIDQPLLDMPDDVSTHWESHPQRPAGDSGIRVVVSKERHTYSLLQLALHNLDEEAPWTQWRLKRGSYLDPQVQRLLPPDKLVKLIASLDLAGAYEQMIDQVFYASSSPVLFQALVQRPLAQLARLELFSARQQGLSDAAQSIFSTALAAKTPQDLQKNGHQLQLFCPHLAAFTLQQPRHIAGVLVIHDRLSAKTLLYWPHIAGHPPLSEHASLEAAQQALMNMAGTPQNRQYLARHIAPGWEHQALRSYPVPMEPAFGTIDWRGAATSLFDLFQESYWVKAAQLVGGLVRWFKRRREFPASHLAEIEQEINEQHEQAPQHWLGLTATGASDILSILAHAHVLGLRREVRAMANSQQALASYRKWRLGEQSEARVRGILSFIPGVSIGVNIYEVLLAARRFHHSGDPADGVGVGFAVLILLADVALMLLPSAKGTPKPGLQARTSVMNLIQLRQAGFSNLGLTVPAWGVKGLEGFKKALPVDGAVALHGPVNKGTFVKAGEQFVLDDGQAYPVYRRRNERALRLKSPRNDAQDELVLYIEQSGERLLGADAPEPRPGPSSGIHRPWEAQTPATEWVAPPASHTDLIARQPVLASSHWQGWGRSLQRRVTQETSATRRLYRVQGDEPFDAIKLGANFYELLPSGSKASDSIVFIKKPEVVAAEPRHGFMRWLLPDVREQPVPAMFGADGLWVPREPLFARPLDESVRYAFPGLTPSSNRFVAERLVELADSGRSMTATRLLNIRLTLDDWLPPIPRAVGQTDDLLRMLRPIVRRGHKSVNIGREGVVPGLERLDFQLPVPLDPAVLNNTSISHARPIAAQLMVKQVLEQQGFSVRRLYKGGSPLFYNFVCTHPKSSNLYFVLTRWAESPSITLKSRNMLQLSDAWFRSAGQSTIMFQAERYHPVLKALEERRLVRIIAGIQRTEGSGVTVFFVKLIPF